MVLSRVLARPRHSIRMMAKCSPCAGDGAFEVLGETPTASQSSEEPLNDPTQHYKPLLTFGFRHDLEVRSVWYTLAELATDLRRAACSKRNETSPSTPIAA